MHTASIGHYSTWNDGNSKSHPTIIGIIIWILATSLKHVHVQNGNVNNTYTISTMIHTMLVAKYKLKLNS